MKFSKSLTFIFLLVFLSTIQQGILADNYSDAVKAFVSKDYILAEKILLPLAESGHAKAQYSLGTLYEKGLGVKVDPVVALMFYKLADSGGHQRATGLINRLQPTLTKTQLAAAEKLFMNWKPGTLIANVSKSPKNVNHTTDEFSITFPDNWNINEDVYGALVHSAESKTSQNDHYQENIRIITSELENGMSTDNYWQLNKNALLEFLPKCKISDEKNISLNGIPTLQAVVSYDSPFDGNLSMLLYLFTKNGTGYTISAISPTSEYQHYEQLFINTIDGISFNGAKTK